MALNLINYLLSRVSGNTGSNVNIDAQKGTAGGIASLDANGKVPTSQLPSYVDDVIEYASVNNFPVVGVSGVIYIAADTNIVYRWGGSAYIPIGAGDSLVVDDLPTENSDHLVTSGGVYEAIHNIDISENQSGVQPDWNQNDSTAADYIQNRPFYVEDNWADEIFQNKYWDSSTGVAIPCSFNLRALSFYHTYYNSNQSLPCVYDNFIISQSTIDKTPTLPTKLSLNTDYQIYINNVLIYTGQPYVSSVSNSLILGDINTILIEMENIIDDIHKTDETMAPEGKIKYYDRHFSIYMHTDLISQYGGNGSSIMISLKKLNGLKYHTLSASFLPFVINTMTITNSDTQIPSSSAVYWALLNKQDALSFDTYPKYNSTKILTSGAIYDALSLKQNTLYFDDIPTKNSFNLVYSGGIYSTVQDLLKQINQLSNKVAKINDLTEEIEQLKIRISILESNQQPSDDGLNVVVQQQDLTLTGANANVDNDGILTISSNSVYVDNNGNLVASNSHPSGEVTQDNILTLNGAMNINNGYLEIQNGQIDNSSYLVI